LTLLPSCRFTAELLFRTYADGGRAACDALTLQLGYAVPIGALALAGKESK